DDKCVSCFWIEGDSFGSDERARLRAVPAEARELDWLVAGDIPEEDRWCRRFEDRHGRSRCRDGSPEVCGHALFLRLLEDTALFGLRAEDLDTIFKRPEDCREPTRWSYCDLIGIVEFAMPLSREQCVDTPLILVFAVKIENLNTVIA